MLREPRGSHRGALLALPKHPLPDPLTCCLSRGGEPLPSPQTRALTLPGRTMTPPRQSSRHSSGSLYPTLRANSGRETPAPEHTSAQSQQFPSSALSQPAEDAQNHIKSTPGTIRAQPARAEPAKPIPFPTLCPCPPSPSAPKHLLHPTPGIRSPGALAAPQKWDFFPSPVGAPGIFWESGIWLGRAVRISEP